MKSYPKHNRAARRIARSGFTMVEVGVALIIVAAAMLLVAQLGLWSIQFRARTAARFVATELAANVLAEAQGVPWESLDKEWANSIQTPEFVTQRLSQATLTVSVETVQDRPFTKRVTVHIQWALWGEANSQSVRLIGFLSRRSLPAGASSLFRPRVDDPSNVARLARQSNKAD